MKTMNLSGLQKSVTKKFQSSSKNNNNNNSGGKTLEEVVKEATAKTLKRPDRELNQQVVDTVPSAIHSTGLKETAKILTDRLELKNPHKVWLAIELIKEVLRKNEADLAPVRDDIMGEVGKVASRAMNRFNSNLADQQRAKSAAFELLKTYGHDGHILSQMQSSNGRPTSDDVQPHLPSSNASIGSPTASGSRHQQYNSWPELREAVHTNIAVATSHNDLLQDLLLDTTSFEAKTSQERALAKDVILEATQFRQNFEALLNQLSAFDNPEANTLMVSALESMDILNNSLTLHKEVLKKELKGKRAVTPSSARQRPAFQPPAQSAAQTQPHLGGLLELDNPGQSSQAQQQPQAVQDPFAPSMVWQQPSPVWPPASDRQSSAGPQPDRNNPFNGQGGFPGAQSQAPQSGLYPPQASGPGGWPGYGPSPSFQGYNGGYPPYNQGYGQSGYGQMYGQGYGQSWGPAPGMQQQQQGYMAYPPYGYHQGFRPQQGQAGQHPGPNMQGQPHHVPPPMMTADVGPAPASNPPDATKAAAQTPVTESRASSGTLASPQASGTIKVEPSKQASPTPPATPPAFQQTAPNGSSTPPPAHSLGSSPALPQASPVALQLPKQEAPAPAPAAQPAQLGNAAAAPAGDDWDFFFEERVGSGKLDGKAADTATPKPSTAAPKSEPVQHVVDEFDELAIRR